eukprot:14915196-Alexandrium_andersonii.AAC.1
MALAAAAARRLVGLAGSARAHWAVATSGGGMVIRLKPAGGSPQLKPAGPACLCVVVKVCMRAR